MLATNPRTQAETLGVQPVLGSPGLECLKIVIIARDCRYIQPHSEDSNVRTLRAHRAIPAREKRCRSINRASVPRALYCRATGVNSDGKTASRWCGLKKALPTSGTALAREVCQVCMRVERGSGSREHSRWKDQPRKC